MTKFLISCFHYHPDVVALFVKVLVLVLVFTLELSLSGTNTFRANNSYRTASMRVGFSMRIYWLALYIVNVSAISTYMDRCRYNDNFITFYAVAFKLLNEVTVKGSENRSQNKSYNETVDIAYETVRVLAPALTIWTCCKMHVLSVVPKLDHWGACIWRLFSFFKDQVCFHLIQKYDVVVIQWFDVSISTLFKLKTERTAYKNSKIVCINIRFDR